MGNLNFMGKWKIIVFTNNTKTFKAQTSFTYKNPTVLNTYKYQNTLPLSPESIWFCYAPFPDPQPKLPAQAEPQTGQLWCLPWESDRTRYLRCNSFCGGFFWQGFSIIYFSSGQYGKNFQDKKNFWTQITLTAVWNKIFSTSHPCKIKQKWTNEWKFSNRFLTPLARITCEAEFHSLHLILSSPHESTSTKSYGGTSLCSSSRLNYLSVFKIRVQHLLLKDGNSPSVMEHPSLKLIFWVVNIRLTYSSNCTISNDSL